MNIVYAAEKPSIATLLSEHTRRVITADEIDIAENPDETGSFRIAWQLRQFRLSPNGRIAADDLQLIGD